MQMSFSQFAIVLLNTALVIISFCSIYNFITMICSEITISISICIILFVAMFVAQAALGFTANSRKYIEHAFWDNGNKYIISQEPDPNYPGDEKVKQARTLYLSIPQGQAMKIGGNDLTYSAQMAISSIILIGVVNIVGVCIFSKKELK